MSASPHQSKRPSSRPQGAKRLESRDPASLLSTPYLREEERRFVTPALNRASTPLVGPPDEIIDALQTYEAAGVGEVVILCPTAASRAVYTDIRQQVIDRY
jgi:hypothetical protein